MSLPVHLVADLTGLGSGDVVPVTGDEAHHAVAVRRLGVGDQVLLTDGRGTMVRGELVDAGSRRFAVRAEDVAGPVPPPQPELVVVQALAKGDRGELAVQVLTEIGAATIVPWAAERSVAVWRGERAAKALARWRSTAREAAKQSRRAWHPEVRQLARTAEVVELVAHADLAAVLDADSAVPLADLPVPATGRCVIVVGPEGGLTEAELRAFSEAGARTVRLGPEVLRTSTAGVAACAAILVGTRRWR